jgi:hypothetical protein
MAISHCIYLTDEERRQLLIFARPSEEAVPQR